MAARAWTVKLPAVDTWQVWATSRSRAIAQVKASASELCPAKAGYISRRRSREFIVREVGS